MSRYLDARDLERIQKLIASGEPLLALKHVRRLDTFVREGIPEEVWDYLQLQEEAAR